VEPPWLGRRRPARRLRRIGPAPARPDARRDPDLSLLSALEPHSRGVYVNFTSDDASERVRQAYTGQQWARLTALKAKYDPTNFFRMNANIPPG
jgi:hypothetical protein